MASDDARAATNANGERVGVARVARDAADLERRAHVISGRVAQLDSNSKSLKLELSALNDALLEYEAKAKSGDATYLTPEVRNSMYTARRVLQGGGPGGDLYGYMKPKTTHSRFMRLFVGGATGSLGRHLQDTTIHETFQ